MVGPWARYVLLAQRRYPHVLLRIHSPGTRHLYVRPCAQGRICQDGSDIAPSLAQNALAVKSGHRNVYLVSVSPVRRGGLHGFYEYLTGVRADVRFVQPLVCAEPQSRVHMCSSKSLVCRRCRGDS